MNPQTKQVQAILPAEVAGEAAATPVAVDTLGFDWATFDLVAGTQTGVTAPTVLKLEECATEGGDYVDVAAFLGGTAFAFPATVEAGWGVKFNVDLRRRMRWLQFVVTPAVTVTMAVVANLGKGEQAPITAAKAGVEALVEG